MASTKVHRIDEFRFALWALQLGREPTRQEIEGLFGISKPSAWRLLQTWRQAVATSDRFLTDTAARQAGER